MGTKWGKSFSAFCFSIREPAPSPASPSCCPRASILPHAAIRPFWLYSRLISVRRPQLITCVPSDPGRAGDGTMTID